MGPLSDNEFNSKKIKINLLHSNKKRIQCVTEHVNYSR